MTFIYRKENVFVLSVYSPQVCEQKNINTAAIEKSVYVCAYVKQEESISACLNSGGSTFPYSLRSNPVLVRMLMKLCITKELQISCVFKHILKH